MAEIDYRTYGLGCLKDEYDPRDYVFNEEPAGAVSYPVGFQLEPMPIKNQQTISSCVAHACATIKEIQEYYETGIKKQFSVGWLYGYRLPNHYQGEGMYAKDALAMLVNYGNVLYNDFPENFEYSKIKTLVNNRKTDCLAKAKQYRTNSYAVVSTTSAAKNAIYNLHTPLLITIDVYESFYDIDHSGIVPNKSGGYAGSHALVIVGWTKIGNTEYYVVQNSWGEDWGDNGYCYIKPSNSIIDKIYLTTDKENVKTSFTDVPSNHWAHEYIDKCVKAGLISGYTDGSFKPSNTITRAEICTMFAKMLDK